MADAATTATDNEQRRFTTIYGGFAVVFNRMDQFGSWHVEYVKPGPEYMDVREMAEFHELRHMTHRDGEASIIATRKEIEDALRT